MIPIKRCLRELKTVGAEFMWSIGLGGEEGWLFNIAGRKNMGRFIYSALPVLTPTTHVDCTMKFNQVMN